MRHRSERLLACTLSFAGALSFLTGCGNVKVTDPGYYAALSVTAATIRVNQQIQIVNNEKITGVPLTFYVNGIAGGNAQLGTIDSNGLYTAPAIVPVPNNITITSAASNADYPPGTAALAVLNPIPILGAVTPTGFSEGITTVTVAGSEFVYGAQVSWNGTPITTTYVSPTQLVASIAAPNAGTFPLLVTNPDPGSSNSATVQVKVAPGQVVLKLEPSMGTDVRVTNSISFGLSVTGTANTGVTLAINGVAGGNATVGTAVLNADGSITYTAPAVVPSPNVVAMTITSVDNTSVAIAQNISVMNPIPILMTSNPSSFNVGSASVVLTGQDFINGAKVLMNGQPVSTTFNSGTQLTATVNPSQPGSIDLQVLNPSPGPATSADLIADVAGGGATFQVSLTDSSRFLQQATFGATDGDVHNLSLIGYQTWLTQQFAAQQTLMEPGVEQSLVINNTACASSDLKCNAALFMQNNQAEAYVENAFWQNSLSANDELRQRVQYALSQIFVISGTNPQVQDMPRGEANYYDLLGADAFGNFRKLLEDVTLNPMMGQFLSMQGNDKGNATTDPDENYAREIMQLFTIGLYQLNNDGSRKVDGSGNPIPTYSNTDVQGLAKVFTGFSWQVPGDTSDTAWSSCCIYVGTGMGEDILPMVSYPSHHSIDEKDFLGVTIPSSTNADPDGDLKTALDTLFNHPNLPPFFCRQLIEHLVTSNPSPAYVNRVASVFKDNGSGVRGDMQAVLQAILLDTEARDASAATSNVQYGKVREALLRYTEWARATSAQSRNGGYWLGSSEDMIYGLGEMPFRSPTVFNWFAPNYVPPGTSIEAAGLMGPEFQMTNVTTVVGYLNYMENAIGAGAKNGPDVFSSYGPELGLANSPTDLVDRMNLLLMAGQMNSTLEGEIVSAVSAISIPTGGDQNAINAALAARVETAAYLTLASPDFTAQQ
ncbi:MAG TPA: DUF1800 domain-containing protein [Terracidiphilus sp.]|jgi:uncharacterized protein (DUF1800 family)|nr:DUF1800 domain-containing protein [Terracidiphilus sp.]